MLILLSAVIWVVVGHCFSTVQRFKASAILCRRWLLPFCLFILLLLILDLVIFSCTLMIHMTAGGILFFKKLISCIILISTDGQQPDPLNVSFPVARLLEEASRSHLAIYS